MAKQWHELTDDEQWEQIKAERAIRRRYALALEVAEEELEDGVTSAVSDVEAKIKAEINALRRERGIVER